MQTKEKKPEIVVFAGPNGSGKSTITGEEWIKGPYINADGQGRKNELPHGQPKKDCFIVVAYFSVDFDFQDNSSIFCFNSSKNLAYNELKGACALWYNVI